MFSLRRSPIVKLESLEARIAPATLIPGFTQTTLPGSISSGTAMEFSPTGLLFVLEQAGTCKVYARSGSTWVLQQANFFADMPLSVNSTQERGLLGIAFDPNYATNRYVYFYHTTSTSPIHNRVIRVTANANHDRADATVPVPLTVLLDLENLTASNHNGGAIHFGIDGKLYIATGENAVSSNSQLHTNKLGKILRMNADGTIPTDNPFYATNSGTNRLIWALGLRNPYTFTFKPGTSTMYINDVGASTFEEVNVGAAGANYGWDDTEGPFTGQPQFTNPTVWYHHSQASNNSSTNSQSFTGAAITGGAFYNSTTYTFPESYKDDYFFADYVSDWIRSVDPTTGAISSFATVANGCVDLKVGSDGALYYLARGDSKVQFAQFTGSAPPYIVTPPSAQTVSLGQPVTFTAAAGGINLSYQWQRNGVDIFGATSTSYTIPATALGDNNTAYRVVVTNPAGNITSVAASLTLTGLPAPARVSLVAPNDGTVQRSMVRNLVVTFDSVVHFVTTPAAAFSLGGSTATVVVGAIDNTNGYSILSLAFSGSGLEASSLIDGSYILSTFGNKIQDEANRDLDGDNNGSAGGDNTFGFFRLRGDADGNGAVDLADFALFRTAFANGPNSAFDFDDDGQVTLLDFSKFRSSFGNII